ncbi:MAG: HIT domain-containing protein [Oscillospiraceae bacterium]
MDDCIFCKIISSNSIMKVYEDDFTVAFMDVAKDVDGHILVVPKKHVKNILDCDTDTLNKVMGAVKRVSNHLVDKCGYEGVNLLNANDESAGQSVPHFHIHIIPRKKNDGIDAWPAFAGAKRKLETVYKEVRMADSALQED